MQSIPDSVGAISAEDSAPALLGARQTEDTNGLRYRYSALDNVACPLHRTAAAVRRRHVRAVSDCRQIGLQAACFVNFYHEDLSKTIIFHLNKEFNCILKRIVVLLLR